MAEALLSIRDLRTQFDTPRGVLAAVDGVSLDLDSGETLGIAGESGSGKSVLVKSLMRVLPLSEQTRVTGQICFEGRDISQLDEAAARRYWGAEIAMVFQDPLTALNPVVRIGRQITESLRLHRGLGKRDATTAAVQLLTDVGVPDPTSRLREYPHQLSGGLRQRVTIAIALAGDPKLLIADEPTTALDVTVQKQILDLLSRIQTDRGMAMILVSHDLAVLAGRTDRTAVMYAGRLVETAPTRELFGAPRHHYTGALMASSPRMDQPTGERLTAIPGTPPTAVEVPPGCAFAPRCEAAQSRCAAERPQLAPVEVGTHRWACHFPLEVG